MREGDLIFDVGMNDGTDSAYYLRKGYSVVAVEANPLQVDEARERFGQESFEGLNVGVAEAEGEADFWVCDDWTAWSSFDREVASRNGNRHHSIRVKLEPMKAIFDRHGMPAYCKVDIEGHDKYCLLGLTPEAHPEYMSVEHTDYPFLEHMHEIGYDRFKFIHQLSFTPPSRRWFAIRAIVPSEKLRAGLERARGALRGALNDRSWYFKVGSSGPLPIDTPGRWLTYEEAVDLGDYVRAQYESRRFGLLDCFDIHATTAEALAAGARA